MTRLSHEAYLDHIRRESARLREVLATSDPGARVPSCPEWSAADLLWHLTTVQHHWHAVVANRPRSPEETGYATPDRPEGYEELLAAYDDTHAAFVAVLAAADPGEQAWSWSDDQTVGFTYRRQAHEALIHRLDAELTTGAVTTLDPALAADGVDELVDVMYGGLLPDWGTFAPGTGEVEVVLTDVGATFRVRPGRFRGTDPDSGTSYDEGVLQTVRRPDGPAAATVRGGAGPVDAWLWHRRDADGIVWSGDPDARDQFLAVMGRPLL